MTPTTPTKQETCARAYLRSVQRAKFAFTLAQQEYATKRAAIDGVRGVRYDGRSGHTHKVHGDDAMMNILEQLEELERKKQEKAAQYAEVLEDWAAIGARMDSVAFELLNAHYVEGKNWKVVAGLLCVSERVMYRERALALCELYEVLPPAWKG